MYTETLRDKAAATIKRLNKQDKELLIYIAIGLTNEEIGKKMSYSTDTIKNMSNRLRKKLGGIPNKTALATFACFGELPTEEQLRRLWFGNGAVNGNTD